MAMTKKKVFEAKRATIARINALKSLDDAALDAEVNKACSQLSGGEREDKLTFLIKDFIDHAFPDHLINN